jgi:HK97 family phage major capsid protein
MTLEEMKTVIDEQTAPLLKKLDEAETKQKETEAKQAQYEETQRKYADIFTQKSTTPEVKNEPGITTARLVKCMALAKYDPEKALYLAEKGNTSGKSGMYPEDAEVKSILKQLTATTPSEGGFLLSEQYATDIIPLLTSKTAIAELGARRVPMPKGNINLPKLTGGATSYYQGEAADATKSQQTFGNIKLSSKKLVTLVPISNDLIRDASIAADRIVRDDMLNQMRLKFDYTGMYGTGTAFTPLGIKKSVATANISVATGTATLSADLAGTMIGALMTDNTPMLSVGWIFNARIWSAFYNLKLTASGTYIYRDEMNRGFLNGYPFRVSTQITTANATAGTTYSDIFLGDFSEFLWGDEMSFEFSSSSEASYYDGSSLQSAFSQDLTILKVISKHDFALRHDTSFLVYQYPYA